MIRKRLHVCSAVFLIFQLANVSAQESSKKEILPQVPETSISLTSHTIQINGEPLKYTAAAGYLLINEGTEKPKANIFFTAYTMDGVEDKSRRPITFAFNGGPGTSSVWLHLGALGPRKALMNDEGFPLPGPYRLVDNEYSILDVTDLVMIDPVSTGYSRPAQGVDPKSFHGYIEDIESMGEFIRLYIARHERWASPKFILGESYGTTRSAGLSEFLQRNRYGMFLKGLILVSCGLNFQTMVFGPGNDLPTILFLPTYTATAWYHKKLPSDLQARNLPDVLDEVERFALEEYTVALMKGNELPADEKREMIRKLARYTGLSPKYIEQTNMRIDNRRFLKEFLRDEHQTVSRLDSRFRGRDADSAGEFHEFDSASSAMYGPFSSMLNHYFRAELNYKNEINYAVEAQVSPWNWNVQMGFLNVAESLRQAMSRNQSLKVFVANGYYDVATPYFATEYTFSHLDLNSAFKGRISMGYYEAGHMMYLHKPSHAKLKSDIANFIQSAIQN